VDQYNTLGIPENIEDTKKVITASIENNQQKEITAYTFKITANSDNSFIGLFGLNLAQKKYNSAEIWFKILPKYWKKGFTTEAVIAILDYCFDELKLHRVTAGCAVDNIGSIRVLEKSVMKREGLARKTLPLKTGWSDNYEYAILEDEFKHSNL
jgi:RimJ/RimL family protein N-acetyltransferase